MKCGVPKFDSYPDTTPEVKAFAVSLWLGQVAGLRPGQQVPDDIGQLPEPEFVRQLLLTWFVRYMRKPKARAAPGGKLAMARTMQTSTKRAMKSATWQAFSRWPCDAGTPWVRPHDNAAENAHAAAERRRIAAGELPIVGLLHHAPALERRERRMGEPTAHSEGAA